MNKRIVGTIFGTLAVMWIANRAASLSPLARRVLKGTSVSSVANGNGSVAV